MRFVLKTLIDLKRLVVEVQAVRPLTEQGVLDERGLVNEVTSLEAAQDESVKFPGQAVPVFQAFGADSSVGVVLKTLDRLRRDRVVR